MPDSILAPVRVLTVGNMYPPHHFGGYELVWEAAVEYLRAAGHNVTVLTTDTRTGAAEADPPHVHRELRWALRDGEFEPLAFRARGAMALHNHRVLERHLSSGGFDAVAWWSMGGLSLTMLETVRRRGIPAVAFVHDEWLEYGRWADGWLKTFTGRRRGLVAPIAERLSGIPTRVDLGRAATYIFVSDFTRRQAESLGLGLEGTAVAHSGIHEEFLDPAPVTDWRWRLLYVGRLDRRKGVDTAIESMARLPPEAELELIGGWDAREEERLRRLAVAAGVEAKVRFSGHSDRSEVSAAYARADVALFPVIWDEPWGLVPLEAMAKGRPVVATGRGGSAEYLRDGENCLLFEAGDPDALAAAVVRLADDPALRLRLRERGLETAPKHTEAVLNEAVERALESATRGSPPVRSERMGAPDEMARFWDERARDDAYYFVDNRLDYGAPDHQRFWENGVKDLDAFLQALGVSWDAGDHVLEIGCGLGRLTRPVASHVASVEALDVSAEMLRQARTLNPRLENVRWIHGNGTDLAPIADASVDACLSHVVFQHIPDVDVIYGYVREIGRVLKPGGWAGFQVSNDPTIHEFHGDLRGRVGTLLRREPKGLDKPQWLGASVDLAALQRSAEEGRLTLERVVGEGTQYCLVLVRRDT